MEKFATRLIVLSILFIAGIYKAESNDSARPVHQLRIYQIFDQNKTAFHERFRDHAARIMRKYEFNVVAMWESKLVNRTEFVYLLEWPDEETMKRQWSKFMADEEWSAIKKQTGARHGTLVGDIQDRTLNLTDYSPRKSLLGE